MKSYIQRMKEIERGRTEYYQSLGTPPGLPTMKGHYSEPEETNRPLPNIVLGNYDVPKNWPTPPKSSEPGAPPGPPIQWQPNTPQTAASGYGYVPAAEPEREVFFYHSDHLGSTAYITDCNGAVSQFICYMPYGEALVDEHSASTEEQPYKFNGKEMDRETGLYYYGARYYDPSKSGVWYGIDPLTEKKPWLSPYVYCSANPIIRIDPDGQVDWKTVGYGALTTAGGVGTTIGGTALTLSTSGVASLPGALLMIEGVVATGLGISMMAAGFLTDPSPQNDAMLQNMPTSPSNAIAKSAAQIVGDESGGIELATGVFMIGISPKIQANDVLNLAKNLSINASILENAIGAGKVAELISISSNGINLLLNTTPRSTRLTSTIDDKIKQNSTLPQDNTKIIKNIQVKDTAK